MAESRRHAMSGGTAGDRGYSDRDGGGGVGGIVPVSPRLSSLSQPTTPEATYQQHWARLQTEMVDTPSVMTIDDPMQSYNAQTQRPSVDSAQRWNGRRPDLHQQPPHHQQQQQSQQQQQQQPFADKVGSWQNAHQQQPQPSGLPREASDTSPRYGTNAQGAPGPIRHRHRRLNSIGSQEHGRRLSNADAAVAHFFSRVVEAQLPAAGNTGAGQAPGGAFQASQYPPPSMALASGPSSDAPGYSSYPPEDRNASAPHSGSQFDSDRSNGPSAIPTRSSSGTTVSLQGFTGDAGGYGATAGAMAGSSSSSETSGNGHSHGAWNPGQQQLHPPLGGSAAIASPYRRQSGAGASHDSRSTASSAGSKLQVSPAASVISQQAAGATALAMMGAASYPSNMRPPSQYEQGPVAGMAEAQGTGPSYGVAQQQQQWAPSEYGGAGNQTAAAAYPSWMQQQQQQQQPPPVGSLQNLYAPHGAAPDQQAVHSTASSYLGHDGGPRTGDSNVSMHSASSAGPLGDIRTGFFEGRTG